MSSRRGFHALWLGEPGDDRPVSQTRQRRWPDPGKVGHETRQLRPGHTYHFIM